MARADGSDAAHPVTPAPPLKFAQLGLQPPEVVHFKSTGGIVIAGILQRPLGYRKGQRYPAIIWAHGGPEGQDALSFSPWSYFLAQEGYVALQPNFRGSTGYGERFRNLSVRDSGGGEIDDIAAAVSYLVQSGLADARGLASAEGVMAARSSPTR